MGSGAAGVLIELLGPGRTAPGEREAIVRPGGVRLSYRELWESVAIAAASLRAIGAGPGALIAVAATDPAGFLVASLAVWSLGCALLPCDARAGERALGRTIERARPVAVVRSCDAKGAVTLEQPASPRALDPQVGLLLYTSGSSAEPKGVLLAVAGIEANVRAILDYLPVTPTSRVGVVVPLSYSYGLVGQAMTTLAAGGTLVLLNDVPFPAEQVEHLVGLGVDGLSTVPASLRLLARAAVDTGHRPTLAWCASAGAPLDVETVADVRGAFPGAALFNQYGLTEASPRVAWVSDGEPAFARGAAGRALNGISIRVVSEAGGAPLPSGVEGEIEVRGPSVMLGYLDDAEATARALRPEGWLRTNDVGSMDEAGFLYVRGRSDGVVKRAGERVSLEEVAATLRRAPGVRDACVLATRGEAMGVELHAFVECDEPAFAALRSFARAELPPAKRPRAFERLDALPRTTNGKIAVGALRAKLEGRS